MNCNWGRDMGYGVNVDYFSDNGENNSNGSSLIRTAIIGGTFDAMHKGHQEYVKLAFKFAEKVYILLTSDDYANTCKQYDVKSYKIRRNRLTEFIKEHEFKGKYSIIKMDSQKTLIGFCLTHEISLALIVPEYYLLFERINRLRELEKLPPFLILVKQRAKTPEGFDISSTRMNGCKTKKKISNIHCSSELRI